MKFDLNVSIKVRFIPNDHIFFVLKVLLFILWKALTCTYTELKFLAHGMWLYIYWLSPNIQDLTKF